MDNLIILNNGESLIVENVWSIKENLSFEFEWFDDKLIGFGASNWRRIWIQMVWSYPEECVEAWRFEEHEDVEHGTLIEKDRYGRISIN